MINIDDKVGELIINNFSIFKYIHPNFITIITIIGLFLNYKIYYNIFLILIN